MNEQETHEMLHKLDVAVAEIRNDQKSVWKRIDESVKLTSVVYELTVKVERQGVELSNLVKTMTELVEDLKLIKERPAKRWENVVAQIIGLFVAATVGFLLSKIGV